MSNYYFSGGGLPRASREGDVRWMQKYEYKCLLILGLGEATTRRLNEYGLQGWELVAVWWCWHYLKRPIPSP